MIIEVRKPKFEPMFVATIYTRPGEPGVYRINVGKEAADTGMGNDEIPVGDYVAQSDFLDWNKVDAWVDENIAKLKKYGRPFESDANFKYTMSRAVMEMAEESPIEA